MKKSLLSFFSVSLLLIASLANAQLPGTTQVNDNLWFSADKQIQFGASPYVACSYNSVQAPDTFVCGLSSQSNSFVLAEKSDLGFNFAHTLQTDPALFVHSHNQSTSEWISISHNGTNGVVAVGSGVVTFPQGISAPLAPNGMMSFSAGAAVTAANWQIGRDADTPNQIHFNVPTGAGYEFSVNDVAVMTMSATGLNAGGLNIATSGSIGGGVIAGTGLASSGTITSNSTGSIGWSIVAGADTACNTTCTNGCVHGWETTAGEVAVNCADATADKCLCAGAN